MTVVPTALIITPSFFGYEKDMAAEFERQGYHTVVLDERPSNRALARAVMRVRKDVMARQIQAYYERAVLDLERMPLDHIVVIKAEIVPRWFLQRLRRAHPSATMTFYTYDAIGNAGNCLDVLDLFDRTLSFDQTDVAHRPGLEYLPLFYTPDFAPPDAPAQTNSTPPGQLPPRPVFASFVGTLHSERYPFVKRALGGHQDVFTFFYVQARWYFAMVKYLTREHRYVAWSEVSFTPMKRAEIATVFARSHAVLDMQRPGQSGMTMRTFEVLASGAILVTSNAAITAEEFYDPTRVVVIPARPTERDADELATRLRALATPGSAPEGFERYSLASWVSSLVADPGAAERRLPASETSTTARAKTAGGS